MSDKHIQAFVTIDDRQSAAGMARELVERRLAACVQIVGPIFSTYRWKDAVEQAEEWLLMIKSREDLYPQLEGAIRELHTYNVPEIVAVPIVSGNEDYLAWLDEQLLHQSG